MSKVIARLALECACEEEVVALSGDSDELVSSGQDIADDEASVGSAVQAVDELEVLEASAYMSNDNSARILPDSERQLVQIAIESIYNKLGVAVPESLALEAETDVTAGSVLARIKELITKLLKEIARVVRGAFNWVVEYIENIDAEAARLLKVTLDMQSNIVPKLSTSSSTTLKYEDASMARRLYTPDGLIPALKLSSVFVSDAGRAALGNHLDTLGEELLSVVKENKEISANAQGDAISKAIETAYAGVFSVTPSIFQGQKAPEGCTMYTTETLIGGFVCVGMIPNSVDALGSLKFTTVEVKPQALSPKVPVLTKDQATQALVNVKDMLSVIRQFQGAKAKANNFTKKLDEALAAVNNIDADLSKESRAFIKSLVHAAPVLMRGLHTEAFRHGLTASRSVLSHVRKSYEKQQEAAAK